MNPSFEKLLSLVKSEDKKIYSKIDNKYKYKNVASNDIFLTTKGVRTILYYKKKFEIINSIEKYYKNINIKRDYIICNYKIDLYFTDYNIGINCDDYDSQDTDRKNKYLINVLDGRYINFNHENKSFNFNEIINNINILIKK